MRKLLVIAMAVLLVGAFAKVAKAVDGDFEISGHINTGFGWQYNGKKTTSALGGVFTEEGMLAADPTGGAAAAPLRNNNQWVFYVGDVELDITKTFGENIRLRADIDFIRNFSNGYHGAFAANRLIEQAYATVNIPIGYGVEFLVGRFNAPMGLEAVDNNDNDLPFHSLIFNFLRPQNLTGLKFYYPFSDLVDLHIWSANNLRDEFAGVGSGGLGDSADLPAFGGRLGFTWGMEGQESTLGLAGAASAETGPGLSAYRPDKWGEWSYIGDLDFNVWINDVFAIGGEGVFRKDDNRKPPIVAGGRDNWYYGGLANFHYVFSDVWDGTLRYTYVHDVNGSAVAAGNINGRTYTGNSMVNYSAISDQYHRVLNASAMRCDAQFHQFDLGINYYITDGAKLMAMYRFDMILPGKAGVAKTDLTRTGMAHSIAANFAYEF